ncbi:MAG TPA: glycosyltransferase family 4 protein [Aliidongia sp.]|nr:glycosyltransferase family 4 protein [Aliidongia sp.]
MAPISVLFTHFGDDWIRGSETVLLDLLRSLDQSRIRPVVWCNGAEMEEAARAAGYPTYRSEFRHFLDYSSPRLSPAFFAGLVKRCRALCREHDIRVLHANSAAPVQWLVPAGFGARLPVLAHLHIDYLRRSRYVLLLHAATLAVGVSRQVIDGLIADGMAPERTKIIHNGIDTSRLGGSATDLRAALGIPADAFTVMTAGSLIERKGHDLLIRAFQSLPLEPVPPRLLILGDGPERERLAALAASLGLEDRIHFLGHTKEVGAAYRAADLFALASRGDSFGLVLAEAGHFELPSVSTRVGGIPEVVIDEETGLLVPPDDVPALAAALAKLMADPARREQLGRAAAARVEAMFTVERMARRFEETYAALAAIPAAELGWGNAARILRPYAQLIRATGKPRQARYAS